MIATVPVLGLAAVCATTACSSDGGALGGDESDYTVHPTGATSTITIKGFSSGATDPKVLLLKMGSQGQPREMRPDEAVPVSPGGYCVFSLVGESAPYFKSVATARDCSLVLQDGASLVYTMGQLQFARSCADDLFGFDDAFVLDPWNLSPTSVRTSAEALTLAKRTLALPHAAGDFEYAFSFMGREWLQTVAGHVVEGGTTTVDLCNTSARAHVRLLPPAHRDLPTFISPNVGFSLAVGYGRGAKPTKQRFTELTRPLLVATRFDPQFKTSLSVIPDCSECSSFDVDLGLPPQPPKEIQLGRIDVADVAVTMPDGTTRQVPGTFSILRDDRPLFRMFPTGHGVDVFPGHYTVEVTYYHPVDAAQMRQEHKVDVP